MNKISFKMFKIRYLERFRKYYKMQDCNRKNLKAAVYDNPKLTNIQKKRFWELVMKNE